MAKINKAKLKKRTFILTGMLFLLGGFVFIGDGKLVFGALQVLGGITNLLMAFMRTQHQKWLKTTELSLNILNIIIPISIALDYFQSGTRYIQYVWIFVAILNTAVWIFRRN